MQGWSLLLGKILVVDREEEDDAEFVPNLPRRRWQQKVAECVDTSVCGQQTCGPILTNQEKALMRSQTGPLSSFALHCFYQPFHEV